MQSLGNLQENRKRMIDSFFFLSSFVARASSTLLAPSVSRVPFQGAPKISTELDMVFVSDVGPEMSVPMLTQLKKEG